MTETAPSDAGDHTPPVPTVSRRRVFYVPGYDPFHPRRYRELYRTEGAKQASVSGYDLDQQAAPGDRFGWRVQGRFGRAEVTTGISVLYWSDLVRTSMQTGVFFTYVALLHTAWIYIATGTLGRLMLLRKGPVIAALYPVAVLLAQLAVSWAVARGLGGIVSGLAVPGAGWIITLPVFVLLLRGWRAADRRIFAYYLMHDYAFTAGLRGAYPDELEARLDVFADEVAEALASDVDEVLVVGHSSGAHLAVSLVADLIRSGRVPAPGPALSLLTLGQVIPMVSFLPEARRLRGDLRLLSGRDDLTWIDVTAPGDGCSFALCDPVAVSGVADRGKRWPLVFSAAFRQTLSEAEQSRLKWRFFRLHFQYLCAFDRPKDYDYFAITAGPMTLGQRYATRKPSVNRIDVSVSKYNSVAA